MAPSITPISTHYALVIDAGSSGSRLQIYSWRDPDLERAEILQEVSETRRGRGGRKWWWGGKDGWNGKGKGKEREMETTALRRLVRVGKGVEGEAWLKKAEPGISSVDPADIPNYLSPLLSDALQQIPPSQHASTPIYLLATAGMRLLPDTTRDAILSASCDLIRNDYPFLVEGESSSGPCGDSIRVISGEEEGMWGWVAVNYLMDGFGHAPDTTDVEGSEATLLPLAPLADPPPDSTSDSVTPVDVNHHSPTFGFLDMGGASTQLAFSPSSSELAKSGYSESDLRKVSLRLLSGEDVEWPVFVASWLGFGTNQARDKFVDILVERWRQGVSSALDEPIPDPCLPLGLEIPSSDPNLPNFIGSGSFSTCLTELRPLLDHSAPCPKDHCLFGGIPTPHIDFERQDQRGFIGISEYWYTAQQVLGLGGMWDWGEWEKGMSGFCSRQWGDIEEQVGEEKGWRGAEVELSRLQMQCFKGAWISNVLHDGIGIPRLVDPGGNDTLTADLNAEAEHRAKEKGLKTKQHFQSMDEVGETAISWTLGKMVIEASKAVQPRSPAMEKAWAGKLPGLALGKFEDKMNDLGIQTMWAYAFVGFFLLVCVMSSLRRRFRIGWMSSPKRGRKPSISGGRPELSRGWSFWPFGNRNRENDGYSSGYSSLEEGIDLTPVKSNSRATIGRLRLWSLKLSSRLKRALPYHMVEPRPRTMRHASLPVAMTSYNSAANGYTSQPSSPTHNSFFFTPIQAVTTNGSLSVPSTTPEPRNLSALQNASSTPPTSSSPPRLKGSGRPSKPRQNSSSFFTDLNSKSSSNGWNDPPTSMLAYDVNLDLQASGTLTPGAGRFEVTLSRNSSRVNLSDLGVTQRSASRATTPMFDDFGA